METIGNRIRKIRLKRGMSLNELTAQVEASPGAIWRLEKGEITDPHASRIVAIAQALHVTTDYLLGLRDE